MRKTSRRQSGKANESSAAGLTPKQKLMLDFIVSFTEERGFSPSQTEIAQHFKFKSLGTVQNYLVRLEEQGVLRKTWNGKRTLQVLMPPTTSPTNPQALDLPLAGRVAAGRPIEAIEGSESVEVPMFLVKSSSAQNDHYVLQVEGDSMKDDGILDGDYVIVKKQKSAENGQTVVAIIDGEATLKRFYKKGDNVELHPANASYKPFVFHPDEGVDFRIEGLYVGLIRQA